MDSFQAFAMGQMNSGKPSMVFDWHKAARRIRDTKPSSASAGLSQDWEWTGGEIYRDGKPVELDETYVYLASTWAIPELELDGEVEPCFLMESESPGWDAHTYWPESARSILGGEDA